MAMVNILISLKFFAIFAIFFGYGVLDLEASHHVYHVDNLETSATAASESYRTAYHFQPPKNWMNDPNGPMIYKGIYHLFYQYNPKGVMWGNIVWAHSTSKDLVNWTPHEPALYPSQQSDINGTWSGSATFLTGGKPAMLYTGIDPLGQQVQNLATPKNSSDPYLIEWVKSAQNPIMEPTTQNQLNASSFRDPTTAWLGSDNHWRVVIGSKINRRGLLILYRSKDFVNWVKAKKPMHSAEGTGMWECPDFYPVGVDSVNGVDLPKLGPGIKHVLKVSLDDTKHDYYTIGKYDDKKDIYTPNYGSIDGDLGLRYDYGKFYASKTFFDSAKNRRILWGWINESSTIDDDMKKGWSGLQAVPRTILLDKSRMQLVQWPIQEIEKLRYNPVRLAGKVLKGGGARKVSGFTAAQANVEISFKVTNLEKAEVLNKDVNPQLLCSQKGTTVKGNIGPIGLHLFASKGMEEHTSVFFRIFRVQNKYKVLMCSDQSRSSLNPTTDKTTYGTFLEVDPLNEELSLRCLIDHSIVESFGGKGKSCITARVYPELAINENANLYAFNYGKESVTITNFSAWSMKKAQIN
ncbi:beta-fructofuranosidase, cell wall isozyme-like [Mercurialis annua]|uniref:beta-fructofuranosidase, cell wall isozyme-like n=1 Tax=Mercurialis annua TaxID=3986 RepID=UPI0024AD339C|nr:beta-fructofuranosidase, cell wall isozyme-like [Mercurialis annua]